MNDDRSVPTVDAKHLPEAAGRSLSVVRDLKIWYVVSRNACATSCRDAANKRKRLGNTGIPLYAELKSWLGKLPDGKLVALHCRAHEQLDFPKIEALLGSVPERLGSSEMDEMDAGYGLVNPFQLHALHGVRQVFDLGVLDRYFAPHTMMTNLGDCTVGVEFDPSELVRRLPGAEQKDLVSDRTHPPKEPVLGILTGNSPDSGMLLWRRIVDRVRDHSADVSRGDTSFPRVLIDSVPEMGLSMELEEREAKVREVVRSSIEHLCTMGATTIGIACNTTQYFSREIEDICTSCSAEHVSLVDALGLALSDRGVTEFDLLAVGPASDLRHYSDFRRLADRFTIHVADAAGSERIEKLVFLIKDEGVTPRTINQFRNVVNAARTDNVVLAVTELCQVYANQDPRKAKTKRNIFDTVEVLANTMADRYLQVRLPHDDPDGTWLGEADSEDEKMSTHRLRRTLHGLSRTR